MAEKRDMAKKKRGVTVGDLGGPAVINPRAPSEAQVLHDAQALVRVGEKLRFVRESRKMTQEQLAESAKLGRATIVRYERGEISKLNELARIAEALHVPLEELFVVPEVKGVVSVAKHFDSELLEEGRLAKMVGAATANFLDRPGSRRMFRLAAVIELFRYLKRSDQQEFFSLLRGWAIAKGYSGVLTTVPLEALLMHDPEDDTAQD